MKCVVGIDIGGTNIRIGTVWEDGSLTNFFKKSSSFINDESGAQDLKKFIEDYLRKHELLNKTKAITIGVPSSVSKDKKRIYSTPNLKGLDDISHVIDLSNEFNIPVYLDRDVNFLLMNDIRVHGLDDLKNTTILGMYLGTGFGNAIYINGDIYTGKNGVAGELGHIPLYGETDICTCGNVGCAETRVSGRYLSEIKSKYFPDEEFDKLFEEHGNHPILKKFIEDTALVIATEVNIMDPDYVILAGGVISMKGFNKDYLIKCIKKLLRKPYPFENFEYIFAHHVQDSGVRGGYAYVKKHLR